MVRILLRYKGIFSVLKRAALLGTVIAFIWVQIAPSKVDVLHPAPSTSLHAYADGIDGKGNSSVKWLDKQTYTFECNIEEGADWRYCGLSLKFLNYNLDDTIISDSVDSNYYPFLTLRDLTNYEYLKFDLDYQGDDQMIRLYMRNAFNMPEQFSDHNEQKFLSAVLEVDELTDSIKLMLNEFSVADWWLAQFQRPRKDGVVTFDKIFEIGVDFPGQPPVGKHTFTVSKIVAVGEYLDKEAFYFGIIVMWLCIGLLEGCIKLLLFVKSYSNMSNENTDLREQAHTDALTGISNRHGVLTQIDKLFSDRFNHSKIHVLVIDLDHFKSVNDKFGHDMGDIALVQTASALQAGLRANDVLGRWGGEEFLVVCSVDSGIDNDIEIIIERLQAELQAVSIKTAKGDLQLTMSIGVALAQTNESFDSVFKRADKAVYAAKAAGRNTWVLAKP